MKQILTFMLIGLLTLQLQATGEASTFFQIFVPPNNDPVRRDVCLIVTAIYDSTQFQIVDDGADGDTDDSKSGLLMAGQSYVLFIRENGVNDDAPHPGETATKQDGDYFTITANKLVLASQSTKSDWQHDWVPATNKTSKGNRFIIYAPPTSYSPRDVNVFAYEDSTEITIRKISTQSVGSQGYTQVDMLSNDIVVQRSLGIGEDLIFTYNDGRDLLQSGHTYLIESSKGVTVQYGALHSNARDGGGYVPSSNGSSTGDLFYFTVPYQGAREQEVRIVSWDSANAVSLDKYVNGVWVNVDSWSLGELSPGDWISYSGNVNHVFRVSCTAGKQVSVFEANWLETGSPGTSDVASMLSGRSGYSAGKEFLAYMSPPGKEERVTNPFTGLKFDKASHLYLFAQDSANVTVKDAYTNGQVINRTYAIPAGRYADCFLDLNEWRSIYNGDGNPNSGPERPYLVVSSDEPISVLNTNFNDNWMTYMGTPLGQAFSLERISPETTSFPGDTVVVEMQLQFSQAQAIQDAAATLDVGNGGLLIESSFSNNTTGQVFTGSTNYNPNTGHTEVNFDSLGNLSASDTFAIDAAIYLSANYADGSPIADRTVVSAEATLTGTVNGQIQQAAVATGIVNQTSRQGALRFTRLDNGSSIVTELGDHWSVSFVDYNNDGYDDIFLPGYDVNEGNVLYRNTGNGFSRLNFGNLINELGSAVASTWGDYDNDGDEDVFIASNIQSLNYLYRNDGNGVFTKVNAGNISEANGYCHSASWVDVDNDGWLDLFVVDFMPTRFNKLYKNNGDGTFTELTDAGKLVLTAAQHIGATWADFDMDGDEDVFIPHINDVNNELYRNDGNGKFTAITNDPVVQDGGNSVGSSWGDIDNDGDLDLYVTNASNQPNFLYKNNGNGTFSRVVAGSFSTDTHNSAGSSFGDVDNDGDLDLYVTNDQNELKYLYVNDGLGNFSRDSLGMESSATGNTFGTAMADVDRDGDLDIFVATHSNEPNALFINNLSSTNAWAQVKLIGTQSNRSAIGATLRVLATINNQAVWQTRHICGQTGGGAGSQDSRTQHIGLGDATQIDSLVIFWPSGYTQTQGVTSINQLHVIPEEQGSRVAGTVFWDKDTDCQQDSTEQGIGGVMLEVLPGPLYVSTQSDGSYEIWLPNDNYQIRPVNATEWNQVCPANGAAKTVNITQQGSSFSNIHFGLQALCSNADVRTEMGIGALRRGFRNNLILGISNDGVETAYQAELKLELPASMTAIAATIPWDLQTVANGITTYTWTWDSLAPLSHVSITVTDSVFLNAPLGQVANIRLNATHAGQIVMLAIRQNRSPAKSSAPLTPMTNWYSQQVLSLQTIA